MEGSRAGSPPSRHRALALLFAASVTGAGAARAAGAPAFITEIMPPATCLAAPERACLLAAYETVVSRYEDRTKAASVGKLRLLMAIGAGLDDPGADALLTRYDPKWSADRLKTRHAEVAADAAKQPAQTGEGAPSRSDLPAEQGRILAISDEAERGSRARKVIRALIAARRFGEAEKLLSVVLKSMHARDSSVRDYLATASGQAFAEAGEWPAWSRSMAAGGYVRMMADATMDSDPESDPTDFGISEPLRLGIEVKDLLPWVARAKNPRFRDFLLLKISAAAFERGRVAAWTSDREGFLRYVAAATARGELLVHPDHPFDEADPTLLRFCYGEAKRGDRALALVAALQNVIKPPLEDTPASRDSLRERVLAAIADGMVRAER